MCRNGGKDLYVSCTNLAHCTPYYKGMTACIDSRCCTSGLEDPTNPYNNNNPYNPYNGNNPYTNGNNPYNPYPNSNNPYYEQGNDFGKDF